MSSSKPRKVAAGCGSGVSWTWQRRNRLSPEKKNGGPSAERPVGSAGGKEEDEEGEEEEEEDGGDDEHEEEEEEEEKDVTIAVQPGGVDVRD